MHLYNYLIGRIHTHTFSISVYMWVCLGVCACGYRHISINITMCVCAWVWVCMYHAETLNMFAFVSVCDRLLLYTLTLCEYDYVCVSVCVGLVVAMCMTMLQIFFFQVLNTKQLNIFEHHKLQHMYVGNNTCLLLSPSLTDFKYRPLTHFQLNYMEISVKSTSLSSTIISMLMWM